MTKFFFKFKKPYSWPFLDRFWPFLPQFLGQTKFSHEIELLCTWHNAKIQRNLMIQFQEKTHADVRRQGSTDPIS